MMERGKSLFLLTLETLDAAEFHVRPPNVLMTSWMV